MKKTFLIFILLLLISSQAFADLSVIVNAKNSESLSSEDIKLIFLGKKGNFSNGVTIIPVALPETSAGQVEFLKKVIQKSQIQFKIYWAKKLFTGKGIPPKEYENSKEIIEFVKTNTDTIGFILSNELTDDVREIAKY